MKALYRLLVPALAILLLSCCAALQRPTFLESSMEVSRIFQSGTILPDYTYYYAGPQDKPDTIIAIRNDYEFQKSIHWHEVELTEEQLDNWNMRIGDEDRIRYTYDGAYILNPDGQRIGLWYSKYGLTVIKYPQPKQVIIYRPDPTSDQRWREGILLRND